MTNASLFLRFAETADKIAATSKRLEKAALLGEYFASLPDDDLPHAARYFAGQAFSQRDQRTTNVGGSALLTALGNVTGGDADAFRARLVTLGDPGDAAQEAFAASPQAGVPPTLTLGDVADFLETLAGTAGSKAKVALVTDMLRRAGPLEAKYLVKLLAGDLRIGLKEGAVEDGIARLAETDVGRIQWVNMLEGDIGRTALMARRGELDQARMRLFHPLKFMLATPAADLADVARQMPTPSVVEDKYDGIRAQVHIATHAPGDEILHGTVVNGVRIALFSRTLDEITGSYPDLWDALARIGGPLSGFATLPPEDGEKGRRQNAPTAPLNDKGAVPEAERSSHQPFSPSEGGKVAKPDRGSFILDGELLPVQGERILPFQELQKRLGRKTLTPEILAQVPVAFVAYDLLYADGEVLIERPFAERRARLESLPVDGDQTRRAASRLFTDAQDLDEEFTQARARGNEGLMVKDPTSPYKPGRRGRDWLKIKRALATLDVVVTSVEVGSGRRSKFLSDYTFAVRASETDPTLLNVGKAYSGLTDAEIQTLSDWFTAHTLQQFAHGKVRTVEPQIVLEVTFDRVQPSARHKGGFALRFPRILRIRDDKPVGEIDTIETVRKLAETQQHDEVVADE